MNAETVTLTQLAGDTAEAVRALNHSALKPADLTPIEICGVIGEPARFEHMLGQLGPQLGNGIEHRARRAGSAPTVTSMTTGQRSLTRAGGRATQPAVAADEAQSIATRFCITDSSEWPVAS